MEEEWWESLIFTVVKKDSQVFANSFQCDYSLILSEPAWRLWLRPDVEMISIGISMYINFIMNKCSNFVKQFWHYQLVVLDSELLKTHRF